MIDSGDVCSCTSSIDDPLCVLIVGGSGQVGWELQNTVPERVKLISVGSAEMDIRDKENVYKVVSNLSPRIIINAAAYTSVDKAEEEPDLAFAVNATGAGYLADAAYANGSRLIHISTDFVFDGKKSTPYMPDDMPNPLCVYGKSKLAGEKLVAKYTHNEAVILRTAWVYSVHGNNFVKTMLKLMRERKEINVVSDQIGSPTWAKELAVIIWELTKKPKIHGIHHWSDKGSTSWYDFSLAIRQEAMEIGILTSSVDIHPIKAVDFQSGAPRPPYSVLDATTLRGILSKSSNPWRHNLRLMLKEKASHIQNK
jgi:dTDP-4-dehydrorhamnose reductase